MKKFRMFRVFFLLFAVLFALSGCTGKTTVEQSGNAYTIYYLNTSGIQLVGSEYRTETTDLDALVRELLDKMGNVPADLDCQRGLPVLYQQQLVLLLCQLNFQQFLYNRAMPGLSFPFRKYVPSGLVFLLPGSFWQFALTARLLRSVLQLLSVPVCSGALSHLHGQLFLCGGLRSSVWY